MGVYAKSYPPLLEYIEEIDAVEEARKQAQLEGVQATAGFFGSIGDLAAAAGTAQVGASKEAAMLLFEVQKAAALAQAGVNTALAVSNALVTPPPAGPILAAAALASGIAQAAEIASAPPPSFSDTPGVMQMNTRGAVSLASGDYFAAAKSPHSDRPRGRSSFNPPHHR